ncbi:Hypp1636 [Branchiostoma lanceolatum]|uniref:Hypp1636 protein n=1 Tax=Branchiostoma lanceolatum TaxID=7740 RepID=A0A8J9ZJH0_BRALA|nr:Hypp1636 [Branchiostoma lanceolatum]
MAEAGLDAEVADILRVPNSDITRWYHLYEDDSHAKNRTRNQGSNLLNRTGNQGPIRCSKVILRFSGPGII